VEEVMVEEARVGLEAEDVDLVEGQEEVLHREVGDDSEEGVVDLEEGRGEVDLAVAATTFILTTNN
jgi:hypothetical protein